MDYSPDMWGQRTGDDEPGKAAAGADVDPRARGGGKIEELQGICDVPGPQGRDRRFRNQIGCALPGKKERRKAIEPPGGFT